MTRAQYDHLNALGVEFASAPLWARANTLYSLERLGYAERKRPPGNGTTHECLWRRTEAGQTILHRLHGAKA